MKPNVAARASRRKFRLARAMSAASAVLLALALVACLSLKWVTDVMERRAGELQLAARQRYRVQLIATDVLRYGRLSDLIRTAHDTSRENERAEVQANVFRELDELRGAAAPENVPAIDKASTDIRSYFDARRRAEATGADMGTVLRSASPALEAANSSLGEVARIKGERAAERERRVQIWSRRADQIAYVITGLFVLASAAVLIGMRRAVLRPLLQLTAAMRAFTRGDRSSRAEASPALELASAADSFNEMADVITGQHRRMIDFIGGASAELRNPVDIMQTALQELAPDQPVPPEGILRSKVALLSRELDRLDRMVENFLDASRVEWDRLDLQQDRQDLRQLVEDAAEVYRSLSSAYQILVTAPEQPVCVYADGGRLGQVLHALLSNAIEGSPGGGVVSVDLVAEGQEAILTVTDHGVGIAEEDIRKIFEPFRKTPIWRGRTRGIAIALFVARRIVDAHGGELEAESVVGQGTTLRMRLPLARQPPESSRSRRAAGAEADAASPRGADHG
jgi:signal transduction histidine kinase